MIFDALAQLDNIIGIISTSRYERTISSDVAQPLIRLSEIQRIYSERLASNMDAFRYVPHSQLLIEDITVNYRDELNYLRGKSQELTRKLEEDDLGTMPQETLHFLNALQAWLSSASGKFISHRGKHEDLLDYAVPAAFTTEQQHNGKSTTVETRYEERTEPRKPLFDNLGYKMYLIYQQVQRDWIDLISASEKLKFIRK